MLQTTKLSTKEADSSLTKLNIEDHQFFLTLQNLTGTNLTQLKIRDSVTTSLVYISLAKFSPDQKLLELPHKIKIIMLASDSITKHMILYVFNINKSLLIFSKQF